MSLLFFFYKKLVLVLELINTYVVVFEYGRGYIAPAYAVHDLMKS